VELNESSVARGPATSPGDASGPNFRKRARFALALGAAAFALVFVITSGAGPGLDPDAMAYLGATTSLVQHGTLRVPSNQWDAPDSTSALTTWPPAFSIAMAVPRALGADPLLSARIVNALAAFVTAAVLFLLFESAAGTIAAIAGVLVVLVTTSFVGVHLSVLSEPLFLASLVLTLWAMVSALRRLPPRCIERRSCPRVAAPARDRAPPRYSPQSCRLPPAIPPPRLPAIGSRPLR